MNSIHLCYDPGKTETEINSVRKKRELFLRGMFDSPLTTENTKRITIQKIPKNIYHRQPVLFDLTLSLYMKTIKLAH
jgi:hypothetical protein